VGVCTRRRGRTGRSYPFGSALLGQNLINSEIKQEKNAMNPSTKDNAEGKMHQVKGKIKETVGKVVGNENLEAEGKVENLHGKVQEKLGKVEKAVGK
jgi:uncharacterized protein YjbJ (UPF0337 family)